ncbi:MAG: 30S ribosomal protein S18 [Chloroflexi bacterium]|nr:30S ribosomal protein S18 [Chloroflexota bacterium]
MVKETEQREPSARPRRGPPSSQDGQREPRRRFGHRPTRKGCAFCAGKVVSIDYKKADMLHNYVSERGKILPRRATGVCARHQRELALAIKRARHLALLPYTAESRRG